MVNATNIELFNSVVSQLKDLMPMPITMQKIVQLTRDPQTELKNLVTVIEQDQALAAKILKMANSSYYGFSKQIKTISHAVVCLGYNTIKNLVLAASTYNVLNKSIMSYALEKDALYMHSYAVAIGSRQIARYVGHPNPEEVYLMGLMHDMGKVILDQCVKQQFIEVIRLFKQGNITFLDAEERVLGFNHGEIGAKVAEKWNMSEDLIETIQHHHHPDRAKSSNIAVHMVHVANMIVCMMGIGLGYDGLNYDFCQESMTRLNLTEADFERFMVQIMDELQTEEAAPE